MAPNTENILAIDPGPVPDVRLTHTAPTSEAHQTLLRIVELALVLGVGFASSIFQSFIFVKAELPTNNTHIYGIGSQLISLAMLAYILIRQRRSYSELGIGFSLTDLPVSVILCFVGLLLGDGFYFALRYSYHFITGLSYHPKAVGASLFGVGVVFSSLVYAIINPFKEELIARAFLMTEIRFLTKQVWLAIVVSVLFQTSYHFYQGVIPAISHLPTFLIFAWYFAKRGRITPVILAHLYLDVIAWTSHALS